MKSKAWMRLLAVMLLLAGCKGVEYVPVKEVVRDSIYLTKTVKDSIYQSSEKVTEREGDTVWVRETLYKYKEKMLTDTMYIERVDSVAVPYPVERKLTKWERAKIDWGGWAMLAVVVLSVVVWWLIRARKE